MINNRKEYNFKNFYGFINFESLLNYSLVIFYSFKVCSKYIILSSRVSSIVSNIAFICLTIEKHESIQNDIFSYRLLLTKEIAIRFLPQ
jgi:hypothetical protein